jgi:hypothetical protein
MEVEHGVFKLVEFERARALESPMSSLAAIEELLRDFQTTRLVSGTSSSVRLKSLS